MNLNLQEERLHFMEKQMYRGEVELKILKTLKSSVNFRKKKLLFHIEMLNGREILFVG